MATLQVLCIDDNPVVLTLLEKTLPPLLNAEVRAATSVDAGIEAMSGGFIPDVLLLDYMMPQRSGLELATALKLNPAFNKTCIILHSAVGPGLKRSALTAGIYQALHKPMKTKDLADAITATLTRFRAGEPSPLLAALMPPRPLAPGVQDQASSNRQ